jgi:hypothetical protein
MCYATIFNQAEQEGQTPYTGTGMRAASGTLELINAFGRSGGGNQ